MSARRRAEKPDRDAAREAVFERDGRQCQFWAYVCLALALGKLDTSDFRRFLHFKRCRGPLEMHEPAHSKNVGRTNVDRSVTSCKFHNGLAEDEPELCRKIGWAESGVGAPSLKWAWSPITR